MIDLSGEIAKQKLEKFAKEIRENLAFYVGDVPKEIDKIFRKIVQKYAPVEIPFPKLMIRKNRQGDYLAWIFSKDGKGVAVSSRHRNMHPTGKITDFALEEFEDHDMDFEDIIRSGLL